ncbi:hypothetical protein [Denitromonas halophila]|uniref:Uncharacterized protein n=1 Tax=Denitromonas halophila TaxID=1629404 RepID=A0A557QFH4_9RHOO|nr:hypothetical protein [Denitromonas halophila]TVO51650.1 hypothetical protein FHP91_19515 [Denitromonas halophila]
MNGVYSINSPRRLFERLVRSFTAFCELPSEDGILDVIFPLYHLREWICPGGFASYKNKPEDARTKEELLHAHLHAMPEYEVVRSLCNAVKHYNAETLSDRTDVLEGFRAGLGRVGDSLGVTHFMVDGREIRDLFWPIYEVYFGYFHEAQPGNQPDAAR